MKTVHFYLYGYTFTRILAGGKFVDLRTGQRTKPARQSGIYMTEGFPGAKALVVFDDVNKAVIYNWQENFIGFYIECIGL